MRSLHDQGYAVEDDVLDDAAIARLLSILEPYCNTKQSQTGRAVHAIRNLFEVLPELSPIVDQPGVRGLVNPILGRDAFAVRAIYFDKPEDANWKVPWHQDQTIAVKQRIDTPGFGPWSVKEGVPHVEPPTSILEQMLTARIHLDDCANNNGPLRVIPGSHRLGRLTPEEVSEQLDKHGEAKCTVKAGGVVLMRPTILHASSPAESPSHRRVIHLEFAVNTLPGGLEWALPNHGGCVS